MSLQNPVAPRTDRRVSVKPSHLPYHLLVLLIGLFPAALPAQQTNPASPQQSIKIDFGDKPAPAPVEAPPTETPPPTPIPAPAPPSDVLPLGFAANFVGQGPLEGIPFIWSGPLKAWRSFAPYTNASGTKPSDVEIGQLASTLQSDGLLLPPFLLRLDDEQHLLIATSPAAAPPPPPPSATFPKVIIARGGFPSWHFGWKDSAKGWVSDRQLRIQFESERDRDRDIRTWINQSNFPKGSSFYIDSDNRVVVTPP